MECIQLLAPFVSYIMCNLIKLLSKDEKFSIWLRVTAVKQFFSYLRHFFMHILGVQFCIFLFFSVFCFFLLSHADVLLIFEGLYCRTSGGSGEPDISHTGNKELVVTALYVTRSSE